MTKRDSDDVLRYVYFNSYYQTGLRWILHCKLDATVTTIASWVALFLQDQVLCLLHIGAPLLLYCLRITPPEIDDKSKRVSVRTEPSFAMVTLDSHSPTQMLARYEITVNSVPIDVVEFEAWSFKNEDALRNILKCEPPYSQDMMPEIILGDIKNTVVE